MVPILRNRTNNQKIMKIPILASILASVFATAAPGQTVKAIVESGNSSLAYGAEPSKFATLNHYDVYAPADKNSMTRAYFGFEVTFPEDVSITVAQIVAKLRKDGVDYQSAAIQKYAAPSSSAFPYVVVYNAAGVQTSIDFSNIVGTTVIGKRLVVGALRWKFGSNFPLEQPLLNTSYAEGLTLNGTYQVGAGAPVAFDIRPGNPSQDSGNIKHAFAAVAVAPAMTPEDWLKQLIPDNSHPLMGGGSINQWFTDPSGLVGTPGGYSAVGWQTSTDLKIWADLTNTPVVVSGNSIMFTGTMDGPVRFYRFGSHLVMANSVTW